jgi:hypothetical protein
MVFVSHSKAGKRSGLRTVVFFARLEAAIDRTIIYGGCNSSTLQVLWAQNHCQAAVQHLLLDWTGYILRRRNRIAVPLH